MNEHLARALELAEKGRGTTHPNPLVGAVVVRDGEVVGEGWHRRRGEPHAEVLALEAAGERAAGSTLYLTMEPCAHHGTTPPCTEAVLAAGVSRVVAASLDPNPEAGGGLETLRAAGVDVEHADLFEARAQNEAWRTWVAEDRPFVTYKAAMTLDGRLTIPGERWISGEESRRLVHELRAGVGRGRRRDGNGARGPRHDSTHATSAPSGSLAGSPSAAGRFPTTRSSSCEPARSPPRLQPSPGRASSRSCSRAVRESPRPFSVRACSTSCSSSSRRSSPATARTSSRTRSPWRASVVSPADRSEKMCC